MHDIRDEHGAAHGHGHSHGAAGGPAAGKTRLVMEYTLEHNRQHTEELRGIADMLRSEGKAEAAGLLEESIADYVGANEKFARAVAHLD